MRWTRIAVVLLALAGPVSAQPAPQPLTLLDVPFISQTEALCGGAAAAMVLRYWGERGVAAESFAHLVDRSAAGIRTTALIGELRGRGWNATGIAGTPEVLESEIVRGRPVLALIEDSPGTFHYIVVVALAREAIVFHDPARAPMRVMGRAEFERRWSAADRWMAIVVPGRDRAADAAAADDGERAAPAEAVVPRTPCGDLIADGIARAQAGDLDGAEQRLTAALACAPQAAMRELAGVRLLQRRWPDVAALAEAATALDAVDAHAWRLLGTSRFVQDDRMGALAAWNRASEPRIDLVRVDGLARTRQRIVERHLGVAPGGLLTPGLFLRSQRRLDELPAAVAARLEYVPVPSGLAELRATVDERRFPAGFLSYAVLGAVAAARREVSYSLPPLTGGGERLTAAWRFWPGRPAYSIDFAAPAPWGGIWTAAFAKEEQPFDQTLPGSRRTAGELRVSRWVTSVARVEVHGGIADWQPAGSVGTAGGSLRLRSRNDRAGVELAADAAGGDASFARLRAGVVLRSAAERQGHVVVARFSGGAATRSLPADAWFGGDVGTARPDLLRAHPLVDDGRLRLAQLGRRLVAGSAEAQRWWSPAVVRLGAAAFVDAARVSARWMDGPRTDVDAGAGLRVAVPGLPGTFRADVARGLRDGATAFSFVYEP